MSAITECLFVHILSCMFHRLKDRFTVFQVLKQRLDEICFLAVIISPVHTGWKYRNKKMLSPYWLSRYTSSHIKVHEKIISCAPLFKLMP